jgi:hypothetical protein
MEAGGTFQRLKPSFATMRSFDSRPAMHPPFYCFYSCNVFRASWRATIQQKRLCGDFQIHYTSAAFQQFQSQQREHAGHLWLLHGNARARQ